MNSFKIFAKTIANLVLIGCVIIAVFCSTPTGLSSILLVSILAFLAALLAHNPEGEEFKSSDAYSIILTSLLFLLLAFVIMVKVRDLPDYSNVIKAKDEIIQDYEQYYGAAEELLDSVGVISDSAILDTETGIHYLSTKQLIDETCGN